MECKARNRNIIFDNETRFNRYIVECKVISRRNGARDLGRFNRYIVECKVIQTLVIISSLTDLIDTLWNVKKAII